ncbi:hypothetical protein [uncultured Oscillibacter sp.]|uniref:hypothetical protein n=1 Tax=uncultured Oscillibacter sp. TaxID=876091 RepID=UPI0026005924|nr:hypothetical protein [uncultured Oscillibacter sp.]
MAAIKSELTLGLSLSNENIEVLTRFCESVDFLKSASQSGAEVKLHWPEPAAAPVQVTTPAAVMPPFQQPPVSAPVANPTPAASPSVPNPAYMTGAQPQTAVPTAPSFTPAIPAITPPAPVAPTAAPTYTMDQIAKAGAELAQAGKMPQLLGLLQQFGIQAINMLPEAQYGAFAMALRGLGAQL